MGNNSTNINKTNNHLWLTSKKDHDRKSRSCMKSDVGLHLSILNVETSSQSETKLRWRTVIIVLLSMTGYYSTNRIIICINMTTLDNTKLLHKATM